MKTQILSAALGMILTTTLWAAGNLDDQVIASTKLLDDHCKVIVPKTQDTVIPAGTPSNCGDRFVIDILWVYTPDALAHIGQEDWIQVLCELNIEETNTAFANSELPFSVRMVGLIPTDYDESGDHLALIQGQSDGVMDEVHAVRDSVAADIVVLITVDGFCGLAFVAPNNEAFGFQKVTAGCLVVPAFRHELGHNLGSKHWATDPGGFFSYSAGHVLSLNNGSDAGTAMGGNALPHYSNPRVQYEGVPTGIDIGTPDAADNWLAFMQTAPMVANFRCSGDCNGNGIDDNTEIMSGMVQDCDNNGIPDECQLDLNNNGIIDACDALPVIVHVPEDIPSLQLALSMAESGTHEIVVAPGTWVGPFDTLGKAITVRSSHGPSTTILDGRGIGRVVSIRSGEDPRTIIDGFTITGGTGFEGAGMLIEQASPTLKNCVFTNNTADYAGGGLRVTNGSPLIIDCTFETNLASWGGAVSTWSGTPTFENCMFSDNTARSDGRGGAFSSWTSNSSFINCAFQSNSSVSSGGALFIVDGGGANAPYIANTQFCNNTPDHLNPSQWQDGGGNEFLTNCPCPADLTDDGVTDFFDVSAFLQAFANNDPLADFTNDGIWDFFDVSAFLQAFAAGCP